MAIAVKICGINDASAMQAAVDGGAELVGLIFFPASPRAVSPEQAAEL
ncbi:MAG: N-(5'-phosphoribosyl)anthranilate isomerase, partial [Alphaproteobacteria bacterium]|nr:N-(5'-phosphoribosyl)anthranilate isomerase [Alphaproteobacteria bacterium]